MGGKRKETKIEQFNGVFDDFRIRDDFKNVSVELSSSRTTITWIKTGELDSENYQFKMFFVAKDRPFSHYLKEEVRGALGYQGLPFDSIKNMFFISRDYGSKEIMLDAIKKVHGALEKCEVYIEDAKKQKGSLLDDAQKFNNVFQSDQFHIEYDPENTTAYLILKGTDLYKTLKIASEAEHKVIDIPNYKKKTYLKNLNRSKCFKYSEDGYEHIKEIVAIENKKEITRISKVNEWLSIPENKERLNNVQISEPNEFGLVIKYDDMKKCIVFSCPAYECTFFMGNRGGYDTISNKRENFNMMFAYNEILVRPERPTDINRSESTYVSDQDDKDCWSHNAGKVIFNRRADSKGKMIYLEIEKNIEELEFVKANYEKVKLDLEQFKELSIPRVMSSSLNTINTLYPSIYIDQNESQAYLLHNMTSELNNDNNSFFLKCRAKPLSKDEFYEFYKGDGGDKSPLYHHIQENFIGVQVSSTGANPTLLSTMEKETVMDSVILDYETGVFMKNMGVKSKSSNEKDNDTEFDNSFKM